MKSNNVKIFLPMPIAPAKINRIGWNAVATNNISMKFLRALSLGFPTSFNFKRNLHKSMENIRPEQTSVSRQFINYFRPRTGNHEAVKVVTIVQQMYRRFRRHAKSPLECRVLSNRMNKLWRYQSDSLRTNGIKKTQNFNATMKQKDGENLLKSAMVQRYRRSMIQEHWPNSSTMNARATKTQTVEDREGIKNESSKPKYKSIFEKFNDPTVASEVEDLNIPLYRSKNKIIPIPFVGDIDFPDENKFNGSARKIIDTSIVKENQKNDQLQSPEKAKIPSGYVNLRDHQEESKNKSLSLEAGSDTSSVSFGHPKDAKPYNPDNIPYVEVPDYTDQREESLDEEDRRVAKERYTIVVKNVDGPITHENYDYDEDVVDPDESSDILLDPSKNQETFGVKGKSESIIDRYKDMPVSGEERVNLSSKNPIDGAINDQWKEEEKTSVRKNGEKIVNRSRSATIRADDHNDDKIEQNEDEIERKNQNYRQNDGRPIANSEPVQFDIADYVKSFDFHSSFGDEKTHNDEIADELKKNDDSESPKKDRNGATIRYEASVESKPAVFSFDDEEFFGAIMDRENEKFECFHDEPDFLARYFGDGVISKSQNDGRKNNEDKDSAESLEKEKDDFYEISSTMLKKRNRGSQVQDDQMLKAKRQNGPKDYSKFWTLQYASPSKKIHSSTKQQ